MRTSLKLFTWFGIPVHLHWTFGLILLYAIYVGNAQGGGIAGIFLFVGLFLALFGCVLLHEFGHSLTARRFGVQTQDIILTPIGGIARLERMPDKPKQEFWVAVMGPMVNVAIALVLFIVGRLLYSGDDWAFFTATIADYFSPVVSFFQNIWDLLTGHLSFSDFWQGFAGEDAGAQSADVVEETGLEVGAVLLVMPILLSVNLWLVLFNMIPAFPMDGGRVFRALLAMRLGRARATRVAAMVGQSIAVLFILKGLVSGTLPLILIGFFVIMMARSENNMVQLDEVLKRFKASDLMRTNFTHVAANDWMQTPVGLLLHSLERHFLVFDLQDQLVGVLEEDQILAARKKNDLSTEVSHYMSRVQVVHYNESLQYVYYLMRQKGESILAVADENGLRGVIDEDGLRNFLRLQE